MLELFDEKIIAFTGTREGIKRRQQRTLNRVISMLADVGFDRLDHGDCKGADEIAHSIALAAGLRTGVHPGPYDGARAHCHGDRMYPPQPFLERNRQIVFLGRLLVATPAQVEEQQRSGTWATVRYMRQLTRPRLLIWPDGGLAAEYDTPDAGAIQVPYWKRGEKPSPNWWHVRALCEGVL